ncbi:MAG: phospholipase C, phosphocholine-specific [Phycisphaerae bacterium]|jgi:phospholipase C
MWTRRELMKRAAFFTGAAGAWSALGAAIRKAQAIEPAPGSSFLDAEHVVILMQENRSFDHAFGTLQGVRGFNDPRAIALPNGDPVWVQTDDDGKSYLPFRLDIQDTNATWMGALPHGWTDQTDARNQGRYDRWLQVKRSGRKEYAAMPLTLGYYTRQDIPFYYALADAFTICDQNFCSTLTGTTPNRLCLWTGTIRERQSADAPANVRNEDVDYGRWASWTTLPERLEDHGVTWKIYQNELSLESGLSGEEDAWLANFTDNPLEWFAQYHVRFAATHRAYLERQIRDLAAEIVALKDRVRAGAGTDEAPRLEAKLVEKTARLENLRKERERFSAENFEKLSPREKNLHLKAFCTNSGDPHYRELSELTYREGGEDRRVRIPRGDVLHQFREDVKNGRLPTVSWLVPPARLSDHPGSAWYGAWYVAEAMNILTRNPEVWRKTIFILTYDENDGYFDHVPPFVAPHPRRPETGRVSAGIDTALEYHELDQDLRRKPPAEARGGPIGLGYRVPLIVASPWSRGGCVCSQVFDHTSVVRFLEMLLTHKTGRPFEEPNVNRWRRTVCGDLTSAFQASPRETDAALPFPPREAFIARIHQARFKPPPAGFRALGRPEIERLREDPAASPLMPRQEPGIRRSCPLPYELVADGRLSADRTRFLIAFEARKERFGERSAGSPFVVYALLGPGRVSTRDYAVAPGDRLEDAWALSDFENGRYHLRVYGPNGFFREFLGAGDDPGVDVEVACGREDAPGREPGPRVEIKIHNRDSGHGQAVEVRDRSYRTVSATRTVPAGGSAVIVVDAGASHGWYDLVVRVAGRDKPLKRYAGRVETGAWSYTDPAMGGTSA